MGTKRKFDEMAGTPQPGATAAAGSDGDEDASSLLGGGGHGAVQSADRARERTTGSPHDGDSCPDTSLPSGGEQTALEPLVSETDVTLPGAYEDGQTCLFAAGASGTFADIHKNPDPEAGEVLVIVLPTRNIGVRPIVSYEEFSRGLRQALFGPITPVFEPCPLWTDTSDPWVPPIEYFLAGNESAAVAPPVRFAVVHIRTRYATYLLFHRSGLARLAHEENENGWMPRSTRDVLDGNRGVIKSAIQKLLIPSHHGHSHPPCRRCGEPADWAASCCSIMLCSYCLPREFLVSHREVSSCDAREKGTTLHLINPSREMIPGTSGMEEGWICTRQLLVQVDEERNERTNQSDVLVFRTFTMLQDIQALMPAMRKTIFYHMSPDGSLRVVRIIGGRELRFLW